MSHTQDIPRVVLPPEPGGARPAAATGARRRRLRRPAARRSHLRRHLLLALLLLTAAITLVPRATTWVLARGDVGRGSDGIAQLEPGHHRAAVVLGAGLVSGRPSRLLGDRIEAAVELLDAGRVDLIVVSGDNSTEDYDEPTAMRARAIELGARASSVAADYAGRRTWDTCVRARRVFGIREALVVTSSFHVDRALATCRAAGIDARGVSVDDDGFAWTSRAKWRARELAATGRALVDAWLVRPDPAVGGEPIDPYDPCELRRSLAPSDAASDAELDADCG